jgi:trans-aconitate 2-methyltransferase
MPTWDPQQYMKFADYRLRASLDLLAQIPLTDPSTIFDLGCGPGDVTRLLAERWPGAAVIGVDSSTEMLVKAGQETRNVTLLNADLVNWSPSSPVDLLFSTATMHWLDNHEWLFPRLLTHLVPGGVLALQMPCDREAPYYLLIEATASEPHWRQRLSQVRPVLRSVQSAEAYYQMLAPIAQRIDIWSTEYLHILQGDNPVFEWMKGTALRPYLDVLDESDHGAFLANYATRISTAYPKRPDGRTLLPFRRIFLIAEV